MKKNKTIEMAKISVCIPTFNRAKYLEELLDILIKLLNQIYEIIVVDNNSTDNTPELFKSEKYKNVKFFQNQENIGMVNNWNRCLELASGDYIIIVHDDDIITKELFTEYQIILNKYPNVDFIFSYAGIIDENGRNLGSYKTLKGNIVFPDPSLFILLLRENFIHFSGILIKKDCYEEVGNFSNKYSLYSDLDMWLRISLCHKAIYRDKLLYYYRVHSKSEHSKILQQRILAEKLSVLKTSYALVNSNVKNYKQIKQLIELYYRYKFREYFKKYNVIKNSKDYTRSIVKISLKFYLIITLEFIKSFIQKPSIFETKSSQKGYYYPFRAFGIILIFLKEYFNPPKVIGKVLFNLFKKMRVYF